MADMKFTVSTNMVKNLTDDIDKTLNPTLEKCKNDMAKIKKLGGTITPEQEKAFTQLVKDAAARKKSAGGLKVGASKEQEYKDIRKDLTKNLGETAKFAKAITALLVIAEKPKPKPGAKCQKSGCAELATSTGLCAKHEKLKKEAAEKVKKAQELLVLKKKKIAEIAVLWNAQVRGVVGQVLSLRKANPKRTGINAGSNSGLATIPGGTDNPVSFAMVSNPYGITSADVFARMTGFEGSDSGSYKFRIGDVFVHGG